MTAPRAALLGRIGDALTRHALARAPAEFFLLAACCRWPPDAAGAQAVREAAAGDVDWARLQELIARHRVFGLARRALNEARPAPPDAFSRELSARADAGTRKTLAMAAEALRLDRSLAEAGVAPLFVKGFTLAQRAYGDAALKQSLDIDLLIAPKDIAATVECLGRAGFVPCLVFENWSAADLAAAAPFIKECLFYKPAASIFVDLHWRLTHSPHLLQAFDPVSQAQAVRIGGAELRTLGDAPLFIYLCVHGASHLWSQLNWLADASALLAGRRDEEVEALYAAAVAAGAGRCAGQALLLCARLFGRTAPRRLLEELRADGALRLLEAAALVAMTGAVSKQSPARTTSHALLLAQNWRGLIGEAALHLVAPGDVRALRLPPRWGALYVLLRAPMWVWRRGLAPLFTQISPVRRRGG